MSGVLSRDKDGRGEKKDFIKFNIKAEANIYSDEYIKIKRKRPLNPDGDSYRDPGKYISIYLKKRTSRTGRRG